MMYAAYGSNLHPSRLTARISSTQFLGTGFLNDWSLNFHKRGDDGSAKCSIFPDDEGLHVAVFEISSDDKLVLDRIEGVGSGYDEILLDVPDFGSCAAYVAAGSHTDTSLSPYDWYRELVLLGARKHGFPDEYINRIISKSANPDPDSQRRTRRWETVEFVKAGP